MTVLHLIQETVSLSQDGLHAQPSQVTEFETVEMWQNAGEAVVPVARPASNTTLCRMTLVQFLGAFILGILFTMLVPRSLSPWATPTSYTAHVNVTTSSQTVPLSLHHPLDEIFNTYIYKVVPAITPLTHDGNLWEPASIVAGLLEELIEIRIGVMGWQNSRFIAGPETGHDGVTLLERTLTCRDELKGVMRAFIRLTSAVWILAAPARLRVMIFRLEELLDEQRENGSEDRVMPAVEAITKLLTIQQEHGAETLELLKQIDRQLAVTLPDLEAVMRALHLGLARHADDKFWVPTVLDAIAFTKLTLLPMLEVVRGLLPAAMKSLESIDETLSATLSAFSQITSGGGSTVHFILKKCDKDGHGVVRWEEDRVESVFRLDQGIVHELKALVKTAQVVNGFIRGWEGERQDINWKYEWVRGKRPVKSPL